MSEKNPIDRVPLAKAAADLALIHARIAECRRPDETLTEIFQEAIVAEGRVVVAALDRRFHVLNGLAREIEYARAQMDRWRFMAVALEDNRKHLEQENFRVIKSFPDLPFQGADGKFKIVKNGGKRKMVVRLNIDEKTLSFVHPDGIPPRFLDRIEGWALNKEAVRVALELGEQFDFAYLEERGERLSY